MTSEIETLKTNEFQRRRKLRLQQVREQSKDIAKKIRQRAKVEKLKQVVDLDISKQKHYLKKQAELVKQLEVLYTKGIENVGTSHRSASEVRHDHSPEKADLSKARAREAAAELRRRKQEKLDEQKKILDRKLHAREIANELSRDKSNKTFKKPVEVQNNVMVEPSKDEPNQQDKATKNDMATQCESEEPVNEPEPNIPILALNDDKETLTEVNNNQKSDNSKRLDLFALSEGMPLSLRAQITDERNPVKEPVNLVSEFLRNRSMRLRETNTNSNMNKKQTTDDLIGVKETILRTRSSRIEGKNNNERIIKMTAPDSASTKRNTITMYNHSTRDARNIPAPNNEPFVTRDHQTDDDAYSKAMRESSIDNSNKDKAQTRIDNMRNKVAMTKETVEKEYKETMNFLKSLPKDANRPIRSSHMDEHRQQMQQDRRQHKMQCEYRKIQKECSKHKNRVERSKSKSPVNNFESGDFQYSWMPVPDSDNNLAIHTIPTSVREGKTGNSVKFSKVDSYHEYRSRHKHTPPTKDVCKEKTAKRIETMTIDNDVTDNSSTASDVSSSENIRLTVKPRKDSEISDTERIIIYKILDSKSDKSCKETAKLLAEIKESLTSKVSKKQSDDSKTDGTEKQGSLENINQGVYKAVNDKGNCQKTRNQLGDNQLCQCSKNDLQKEKGTTSDWDIGDTSNRIAKTCAVCKCGCSKSNNVSPPPPQPSAATSATSFKSATNIANNTSPDTGFIKLMDDDGHEAGKFYIGASGILKNDNYEVVIQLRKKHDDKPDGKTEPVEGDKISDGPIVPESDAQREMLTNIPKHSSENRLDITTKEIGNEEDKVTSAPLPCSEATTEPSQSEYDAGPTDSHQDLHCDKGVETSFKLSYVLPSDAPKTDTIHRPGTSTYTQTSFSSPNQRPVFLHMSSSTSTAYMSPPELILPKFLKKSKSKEQTFKPRHQQNRDNIAYSDRQYHDEKYSCDCKRCLHHSNKLKSVKSKESCHKNCSKSKHRHISSHTSSCLSSQNPKKSDKKITCQTKSNKAGSQVSSYNTKVSSKNVTQNVPKKPSQSIYNLRHRNRPITKSNLNPVVENYIGKLLTLNKEGLRVVEVANQECSSVATPGSSIINEPNNFSGTKSAETQISLEQIKLMIKKQIIEECSKNISNKGNGGVFDKSHVKQKPQQPQLRKKVVHKVKSFNVSKNLRSKATRVTQVSADNFGTSTSSSSSTKDETETSNYHKIKSRSKSSPTPRLTDNKSSTNAGNIKIRHKTKHLPESETVSKVPVYLNTCGKHQDRGNQIFMAPSDQSISNTEHRDWTTNAKHKCEIPMTTGTQTVNEDLKYVKVAVDKLQNMEKIADLTEKCTIRLSNLAKVLEEVRKNKSLAYSQISSSDTTSGSENKIERRLLSKTPPHTQSDNDNEAKNNQVREETKSSSSKDTSMSSSEYIPFLNDIPKPMQNTNETVVSRSSISPDQKSPINSPLSSNIEGNIKIRGKPPPALSRIHLKHGNDHNIIPHELSTVLEVDSPMSLKLKNQSNNKVDTISPLNTENDGIKHETSNNLPSKETFVDPDLLKSNLKVPNHKIKVPQNNDSANDTKLKMMDLKQFNDIMLKPFITFQEHAKQCNVLLGDSNSENIPKEVVTDEISSLHSDGSLPDVIAELLKRNIITEPFKYDTVSNINSTSVSSESTMSVLALSKTKKDKKKSNVMFKSREKGETSDSLSISSNPDLEKAFKNLGMGWASSTLKKTKERLALSSSSNTSSSSLSQFKIKSFNNQEIPALVSDSVSSIINSSKNKKQTSVAEPPKNVGQQTSQSTSMTVKDFLKNELAKKITFTNKSYKDDSEEFVSLFETKLPENMKIDSEIMCDQPSMDSIPSGNNRARTSTPVQVYKSMTYQSSTTSNMSNGLFSNADDLSSVKGTSHSMKNHSTSEKDDLLIPKLSLRTKLSSSGSSKSD